MKPYTNKTPVDIIKKILKAHKKNDVKKLLKIYNKLYITDIKLTFETLILFKLIDKEVYYSFANVANLTELGKKLYDRVLNSIPLFYEKKNKGKGHYNIKLQKFELYDDFCDDNDISLCDYNDKLINRYKTEIKKHNIQIKDDYGLCL